jgi:hypothetical protein
MQQSSAHQRIEQKIVEKGDSREIRRMSCSRGTVKVFAEDNRGPILNDGLTRRPEGGTVTGRARQLNHALG